MKNTIKQAYLLFLALSFIMILADCSFIDSSFSQNNIGSHRECADFLNHSECAHAHGAEDNILICDSKPKLAIALSRIWVIPTIDVRIKNSFTSCIWQPPKSA